MVTMTARYFKFITMKGIIFFALLFSSLSSLAASADYTCHLRQYRIDLTLDDRSTHMWLTDTMYYDTIFQAYTGWVEKVNDKTNFHFYPTVGHTVLTFKTQDTVELPAKLNGWINGRARGFPLWDSISCRKVR